MAKSQAKHLDVQHLFDPFGVHEREVAAWGKNIVLMLVESEAGFMFRQMARSLMSLFGLTSLLVTSLSSCVKYQVAHMFTVSNQLLDFG